jgi:hypothetical protein
MLTIISDEDLIYKNKPLSRVQIGSFKGDLYHGSYGVRVKPMSYTAVFDEQGYRNGPPPAATDVSVLGDSFIEFGHDEEDTFSRRLEVLSQLKVRNLGIGGHGPFQYLEVLKRHGLTLKPRYVLFCFFEGNDIGDIRLYIQWKESGVYPYSNLMGPRADASLCESGPAAKHTNAISSFALRCRLVLQRWSFCSCHLCNQISRASLQRKRIAGMPATQRA